MESTMNSTKALDNIEVISMSDLESLFCASNGKNIITINRELERELGKEQ